MSDRRQVPRYYFNGEAQLVNPGEGPVAKLDMHTLSVQGCRGKGEELPPVGQKCDLHLHWEGKEFQAEAEIMWKNAQGEIGLRFLAMDDPHLKLLRNICSGLQVQPLSTLPKEPDKIHY